MTITIEYKDLLLTILTAFLATGIVYFIVVLHRLGAYAREWNKTMARITELVPGLQRLAGEAEQTVASSRTFLEKGDSVISDVHYVTSQIKEVTREGVAAVREILAPLQSAALLCRSFQRGLELFRKRRSEKKPDPYDDQEVSNE